jgi:hypothetical protein
MRPDQVKMQSLSEHQFMDSLFCFGENSPQGNTYFQ